MEENFTGERRVYLTTLLLSQLLGFTGADRFYLGKIGTGIIKMLTFGGFGIWTAMDLYKVVTGQTVDAQGNTLEGVELRNPVFIYYLAIFGLDRLFLGDRNLGLAKWLSPYVINLFLLIAIAATSVSNIALFSLLFVVWFAWAISDLYKSLTGERKDKSNRDLLAAGERYQSVALILSVFTGFLAFDRFYLGHKSMGLLKIFTFGGFGMWNLIDTVQIILNTLKDANGNAMLQK